MKKESIYFGRIIWQLFTSHPITPTSFHMCSHARISTRKVNIIGTEGQHWGYTCCDNQGPLAHPNADFSQYSFSGGDHTSPEIVSPSSPSLTPSLSFSTSLPHQVLHFSNPPTGSRFRHVAASLGTQSYRLLGFSLPSAIRWVSRNHRPTQVPRLSLLYWWL